ncbi:hypothetical protein JTB14_031244 [Gonioctena quinquepunctata]|nr:hypothetical protein JTB14_031244 [Gonioctena quinquepunctata]
MPENIDYTKFFSTNILTFKVMGFWKPDENMPFKVLYNLYTIWCSAIWILFVMSQIAYIIDSFDGIGELTAVLYTAVTFTIDLIKIIAIYRNMDAIKGWLKKLNQPLLQPKCMTHSLMARKTKEFHTKLFSVCFYLGIQTYLFFSLIPLLQHGTTTLTQGWFPFDWRKSPNYGIVYVFQNSVALWNTILALNLDTFSAGLLSQISLQCDFLVVTLNSLDAFYTDLGLLKKSDKMSAKWLKKNPQKFSLMMTNNLIACIEHYRKIKE